MNAVTFKIYRNLSFLLIKGSLRLVFLFSNNFRKSCITREFDMTRTINKNANPVRRLNGLMQKSPRTVAANLKLKPKVFRPMSRVQREIWKLLRSTKLLASKRAFKEFIKNVLADFKEGTGQLPNRVAAKAVEGLHSVQRIFWLIYLWVLCARWNTRSADKKRYDEGHSTTSLR